MDRRALYRRALGLPDDRMPIGWENGTFLYLDEGTLEVGLVRDSLTFGVSDFQVFGEAFETQWSSSTADGT